MRALKIILAAIVLSAGMAEARWYWSVNQHIGAPSGYHLWTGSNNARCIAGIGGDIHVVYAMKVPDNPIAAYYIGTTNLGSGGWRQCVRLTEYAYSHDSYSPSIGLWDRDNLLAVWNNWGVTGGNSVPGMISVVSRMSTDGGASWEQDAPHASKHEDPDYYYYHWDPSLACAVHQGTPIADAAWSHEIIDYGNQVHSWHAENNYHPSGLKFWDDAEYEMLPDQLDNTFRGRISISEVDTFVAAASERQSQDGRPDSIWANYWRHSRTAGGEDCVDTGHTPSITFDSTYETVAYTQNIGDVDSVWVAHRLYPYDGSHPVWNRVLYTPPTVLPASYRPNLFSTHRGTDRMTYMALTGKNSSGTKATYFVVSSNGGETWTNPMPNGTTYDLGTDSVSIWAQSLSSVSLLKRRVWLAAIGHSGEQDEIRVRVASQYDQEAVWDGAPSSGSRQIVRQPGTDCIHRISRLENYLNYERSTDNGETWGFQDAPDFGTNPSIALRNGNPTICYLRNDSVMAATLNSDSEWTIRTLFARAAGQHVGPPSLGVFSDPKASGRVGNCCFAMHDSINGNTQLLYVQFDTTGALMQDTVCKLNTQFVDSACCVSVWPDDTCEVVYARSDSIFMSRLDYSPQTDEPPPDTWPVRSFVDALTTPAARHPYCERSNSRLWVTYSDYQKGRWVIVRTSCDDAKSTIAWEGTILASANDANRKDFPSLSGANVIAWAESSSTTNHWVIKADIGDSLLITLTNPDSNSKFISILADTTVRTTPSTSTIGIYYLWLQQYSGDTWTVPYASKQFLTSTADANVTMYNQGRKLARSTDDSLSNVFRTQQGSIDYATKKDGVEGWTSSLLRSTGDMPCVDYDYLNRVWVADRDMVSGCAALLDVIRCQTRAPGSGTWTDFEVYSSPVNTAGAPAHKISPPAIVACIDDTGGQGRSACYIVFTVYEPGGNTSTTCMAKVSTTGVVYVDTLRGVLNYADSFPSIALHPVENLGYGLDVAWQSGTEVYVMKTTNQDQPEFTTKRTWSSVYNLSNTQTNSRHPQIAADADTVLVAWIEGDSGRVLTKGQPAKSAYNSWGDSVNVSRSPDTVTDYPSIALGDSIIVTYQKKLSSPMYSANYDIMARVNFHSSLNLSNSSTHSKYPHCLFHFHDASPVISTVWTEELSPNYAEVGYKRWQLGEENGGGTQSTSIFDPSIKPALFEPAPNPFARTTVIRYQTNILGRTSVAIHDVTGRKVCNLTNVNQRPGIYSVTWTGRDDRQRQLPEGIYFVRLQTPNYSESRKLILTQ